MPDNRSAGESGPQLRYTSDISGGHPLDSPLRGAGFVMPDAGAGDATASAPRQCETGFDALEVGIGYDRASSYTVQYVGAGEGEGVVRLAAQAAPETLGLPTDHLPKYKAPQPDPGEDSGSNGGAPNHGPRPMGGSAAGT
jgi:hypothetical protein